MRRAAVRLVNKQANLDLSACKHWLRFCNIHYQRPAKQATKPDGHDVVTVFCVMVDNIPPEQQYVAPKEVGGCSVCV